MIVRRVIRACVCHRLAGKHCSDFPTNNNNVFACIRDPCDLTLALYVRPLHPLGKTFSKQAYDLPVMWKTPRDMMKW